MNPVNQSPNTGRVFTPGEKYWLRTGSDYVMPRSVSPFEAPDGYVAVVAVSETELKFDNEPLEEVPTSLDPTDPNMVGAAVSYAGQHRMAESSGPQVRNMPVTLPNALDDHITRERAEQHAKEIGSEAPAPRKRAN